MSLEWHSNLGISAIMTMFVIIVVVGMLMIGLWQFGILFKEPEKKALQTISGLRKEIVIVSAHWKEDLSWLKESIWKVVVCDKIGADSITIESNEKCLCPNVGRESSSYLSYIVSHFESLSPFTAFIHGHQEAWHQRVGVKGPFKSQLLNAILAVDTEKYEFVTLNDCWIDDWKKGSHNLHMEYLHMIWDKHFKPWLKMDAPTHLRSDCCSTFLVSKKLIQRIPKEAYQHWLSMFLDKKQNHILNSLGYCFEYLWHVIFGQPPVRNPVPFTSFCLSDC